MLRLVLLVLYLIASSMVSAPESPQGGSDEPLGLTSLPPETDGGGGWDPLGSPPPETDGGSGWDPLG